MIQTPTLEDVINSFIAGIQATIPDLTTTPVSVTREALINPASSQIAFLFDLAKRVAVLQDVFQATGNDLDVLANSYGLARRTGTTSAGTLYLDLSRIDAVDTITVSEGTNVRSRLSGTQSGTFTIVGNFVFTSTDRAVYEANAAGIRSQLDSVGLTNVRLTAPVPIRAGSVGVVGNIGAFTLTSASIQNIPNVINISPTSGGSDAESDDALRNRIIALFTGNSTGTEAGLLAAATTPTSITGAFAVKFGDPLMTRDGSVYDEEGNLITPGSGRAIDIYVQGRSLSTSSDRTVFTINDTNNFLSLENSLLVGQPTDGNFGRLPVSSITSVAGDESGAAFTQGVAVEDDEGNILIEGNFALIKDVDAADFSIVENLVTRERALATFVNPSSTKFTVIETFTPTELSNSALSQDRILFLRNTVDVVDESITRGAFNGADQLRFSNVAEIVEVFQNLEIQDTIRINTLTQVTGGVAINLPHVPVVSVTTVFHSRLGINIDFELLDAETGLLRLISRTPPRQGDILQVTYTWRQPYQEDLNYNLAGDLIDWVAPADERGRSDAILLPTEDLQTENTLALQPNIASYLEVDISGLSDRQIIDTTIAGTTTTTINDRLALKAEEPFTFGVTGTDSIARIFKVTNVTQGFEYNLTGYKLSTNKFDPRAGVDTDLLPQQFTLSERANVDSITPGDRIVLGIPSRTLAWTSQSDFENNVEDNLAPIFDPTTIDFTPGGVILQTPLLDETIAVTNISGFLTQDTTLSGVVEIIDDLIVTEGVVLDIEPGTTIKVRPSDQLQNQIPFAQRVTFSESLIQQDTVGFPTTATGFEEFLYLYFKPENFNSSFFTVINDEGQTLSIRFDEDILTKRFTTTGFEFFVSGRAVDPSFNDEIESTIDLLDVTSSLKATLLGGRSGQDGVAKFTAALIPSLNEYYVLLERDPITSSSVQDDFELNVEADSSISFDRFNYNETINALIVDGNILEADGYGSNDFFPVSGITGNLLEIFDPTNEFDLSTLSLDSFAKQTLTNGIVTSAVISVDNTGPLKTIEVRDSTGFQIGNVSVISPAETDYILSHFIEERSRIAIIVEGTLRILGATPQTSVLFTSAADSSSEGDWEGIIFTAKSHSNNPRTVFQSDLSNARVRYANVGINIQSSDANVQNCVVRECLSTGISVSSSNQSVAQFTQDDFDITVIGDPFAKFSAEPRLGFSTTDDIRVARFPIPDNLVTSDVLLPPVGLRLSDTRYIVDLEEGTDYTVFIDGQRITAIDIPPADGYVDHSLVDGKDFEVEFDINTGYSLVFLYTAGSSKRRRVFDMVVDLEAANTTGKITIDYFSSIPNGLLFDNLIINNDIGISCSSLATTSINKNTIDNSRFNIVSNQTIATIRNNLVTGYSAAPFNFDSASLIRVQRNDVFSQEIVDAEQTGIADTDILLNSISPFASTLFIRTPSKAKVGSTIRIDEEEMLVQGINVDSIIVARGQNGTAFASHESGSIVTILQLNQIFTVTGIDGDFCELLETSNIGVQLPNTVPLQMRLIAPGTFRVAFPINRRADFFYRYRFGTRGTFITDETEVKVFPKDQIGVGVNDVVNILHEIPLNSVSFTPNNENYSADPLYRSPETADYSYPALSSPASRQNPIYGSLIEPNPNHRYVGFIDVSVVRNLGVGATRIPVPAEPLVVSSYDEVSVIGIDTLNEGIQLKVKEFSFAITIDEANQGAAGVFILDEAEHPTGVTVSGQYQVDYVRPVDLGTTLPPFYLEGDISYVVDAGTEVTINTLEFSKDDIGGEIEWTFQIADSIANLQVATESSPTTTSPINIGEFAVTDQGRAIQINITLKGNDSSFTDDLVFLFPILEDFALNYLPAKDTSEYTVLSLIRNQVQDETNILIDRPITTDTFAIVGSAPALEMFVRKKSDNFDPADEFLLATTQGVAVGDTFVIAKGDLTTTKPDANSSDTIRVDFLAFELNDQEVVTFIDDGPQITEKVFSQVDSVTSVLVQDRETVLPSGEQITVRGLTQPDSGAIYQASYAFEAPLDGETLTISFNFNAAIRESSQEVEVRKSIFTDALVRQVTDVETRIALVLVVEPTAPALSVQSQVSAAIADLFNTTLADIQTERKLDESDIVRATGDIEGIDDIRVTTLSRNLIDGEVVSIIYEVRENAVLEEGSPRINTIQNGRAVVLGSS